MLIVEQIFLSSSDVDNRRESANQQHILRTAGRSSAVVNTGRHPQSDKGRTTTQTTSVPAVDASLTCEG